jgi:hypothetical protein
LKTLLLILSLFTLTAPGQTTEPPLYELPIPAGWGTEKIPFPIGFAPSIEYKGVEEIRFMPGWARKDSADYWSYVFVWHLEGILVFESGILEEKMKTYYEGLASATKSVPREKLIPVVAKFKYDPVPKGQSRDFSGTIEMLDYMQQKKQVLNAKVHSRVIPANNKTIVYFELSPQPFTHPLWKSLEKIRKEAKCIKPAAK